VPWEECRPTLGSIAIGRVIQIGCGVSRRRSSVRQGAGVREYVAVVFAVCLECEQGIYKHGLLSSRESQHILANSNHGP